MAADTPVTLFASATSGVVNNLAFEVYRKEVNYIAQTYTKTYDEFSKSKRPISGAYWKSAEHVNGGSGSVGTRPDNVQLPPALPEKYANARVYDKFHYAGIQFTGPAAAHLDGQQSFLPIPSSEIQAKTKWLMDRLNCECYQDGWGIFATVSAYVDADTVKVTTPNKTWLKVGMRFDIYTNFKTAPDKALPVVPHSGSVVSAAAVRQGHTIKAITDNGDGTFNIDITTATDFVSASNSNKPAAGDSLVYEDHHGADGTTFSAGSSNVSTTATAMGSGLDGLEVIVDDTTNAAGFQYVDRSASTGYVEYRGVVKGNSGTNRPLTLTLLQQLEDAINVNSGEMPDYCLMGLGQRINLLALGLPDVRHVSEQIKLGFRRLTWNGMEITIDPAARGNTIYMLKRDNNIFKYEAKPIGPLTAEDATRVMRISGFDAYDMAIGTYFNLGCDRPNATGKLIDLTEPS